LALKLGVLGTVNGGKATCAERLYEHETPDAALIRSVAIRLHVAFSL